MTFELTDKPVTSDVETAEFPYQNTIEGADKFGLWHANPIYEQPLGALLPKMGDVEAKSFFRSLGEQGQQLPITLFEGKILDGWHRYCGMQWNGKPAKFVDFAGDYNAAADYVVAHNFNRRHLNASQRAMFAEGLATLCPGRPKLEVPSEGAIKKGKSIADAAASANVSERSVDSARKVKKNAVPEVVDAVRDGKLSLSRAEKISALPKEEQAEAINVPSTPKAAAERAAKTTQNCAVKAETVELAVYEALAKERDELKTLLDDMTDVVAAQKAFEEGSPQSEILSLKTQLRATEKKRDGLMTKVVEQQKEIAGLKTALKKTGKVKETAEA
jgi:hypothetical protein